VQINRAADLLEDFTGHKARKVDIAEFRNYSTAVHVGECLGIAYSAVRDGKRTKYFHPFRKSSRPLFCVSADGRQIILTGGSYLFTKTGINDV
jgi:hypothetical protein